METSTINVKIEKSPIPIVWIDTSIIVKMAQWKFKICKLDKTNEYRISTLYELIYKFTRMGKLLCPQAEQDYEIWINRKKFLDIVNILSLGLQTKHAHAIHTNQFYKFLTAFINNELEITLSYLDLFDSDPIKEIGLILQRPIYIGLSMPLFMGHEYHKKKNEILLKGQNIQREKNVKLKISFKKQLELEFMSELNVLLEFSNKFFSNNYSNDIEGLNVVFGTRLLYEQLKFLERLTKKSYDFDSLIKFYKSSYYRSMPYMNILCNLTAKNMIDKQPIKSGDLMDNEHIASIMPYSNLFITDKAKSALIKTNKLNKNYNTEVCYIGNSEVINNFFKKLE